MKKPIFFVDIPAKKGKALQRIYKIFNGHFSTIFFIIPLVIVHKLFLYKYFNFSYVFIIGTLLYVHTIFAIAEYLFPSKLLKRVYSFLSLINNSYQFSGLRSALSSKKIEEQVAPYIRKLVGGKPLILIEYGKAHTDMIDYLKKESLRANVERFHSKLPYSYLFMDKDYREQVGVVVLSEKPEKNNSLNEEGSSLTLIVKMHAMLAPKPINIIDFSI
ncbi:MAG: hypothetical protein KJ915_03025 [Candidatus Omnitrophica bacterium]|nr:hypothetical protein [Candidatus Omnitrophota bacterium]